MAEMIVNLFIIIYHLCGIIGIVVLVEAVKIVSAIIYKAVP